MMTFANIGDADEDDLVFRSGSATLDSRLPSAGPNRVRSWISAALGIVIFLAGIICGAAVMRAATPPEQPKRPINWNDLLARVAKRMQHDLDLTEAQRSDIEQVVRTHQPKLDQIRARTVSEMRAELQQVIEDMSAVLTPEQAHRFRSEAQERLDMYFPPGVERPLRHPAAP